MAPEALKQAISKREIPALLDGGTFKIRRTDLDRFKSRRQSDQTITLPPDDAVEAAEAVKTGEVADAEIILEGVPEALPVEEPTLEAIEEAAETMDTEITLDELDTVEVEPPTATPAEPVNLDLASGSESTEAFSLTEDLVPVSEEIPLEGEAGEAGEESKTVNLEIDSGATLEMDAGTQAMDAGTAGMTGELDDLGEPSADGLGDPSGEEGEDGGLEERVHVLEVRVQGTPWATAATVLTTMVLLFLGVCFWGFLQDHVPAYMAWMLK